MRNPENSSIDPGNGKVGYRGLLSIEKGDHSNMPPRTAAYAPGDERGHLTASSLGGTNSENNVVPMHSNLNHGSFLHLEAGERGQLKEGHSIYSEKTAIVEGHPGDRPNTFLVNDAVTYADKHTETLYFSFTNESYADQEAWNEMSAALPDTFDAPNPNDSLRVSMSDEEYSCLMTETDSTLLNLSDEYAPASANLTFESETGGVSADTDGSASFGADADPGMDI